MLALVIENGKMVEYHLFGKRVTVVLCQRECTFICYVDKWNLFLSHKIEYLKKDSIYYGRNIELKDSETGIVCQIYFYEYEDQYERYEMKDIILIGNDESADIMCPISISIDTKHNTIESNSPLVSINHLCRKFSYYSLGSCLLTLRLKIIFGNGYLLIRKTNQSIKLNKWQNKQICSFIPKINWQGQPLLQPFSYPNKIVLKEPDHISKPSDTNPMITMIPSIMMLSSSSLISILHAYTTYQNTGSIEQGILVSLMPISMLIVTLISSPLQSYLRNNQYNKEIKKSVAEYEEYLLEEIKNIKSIKEQWITNQQQLFPSFHQIIVELRQYHIPMLCDCLSLGQIKKEPEIHVQIEGHFRVYEKGYEASIQHFKSICNEPIPHQYLYSKDQNICIYGEYAIPYFLALLFKTSFTNLKICLITNGAFIAQYPWILKLKSLFYEQKRHIYTSSNHLPDLTTFDCVFTTEDIEISIPHIFLGTYNSSLNTYLEINKDSAYLMNQTLGRVPIHVDYCDELIPTISYQNQFLLKSNNPSFYDLYQCENVEELFVEERWQDHRDNRLLEAPIGMNQNQQVIKICLSEKKHGPHGLVAGTTGSGKSQLLITLVLSLVVNYSYEDIQVIFIDFKGGGLAQAFSYQGKFIPHLIGSLTNLEPSMIERVLCALHRECVYRQKLFLEASKEIHKPITNITEYVSYRKEYPMENIADLLILVDEFAELKSNAPEFLNELISIARIGRSLGIHLLLCTQKPAGIVNDQIWANSKFKICLKVREKHDSLEVLHNDEALYLKETGEFVFECDGNIQKGMTGYSGFQKPIQKGNVQIIGLQGNVEDDYKNYCALEEQQIQQVVKHILKKEYSEVRRLWMEPIGKVSYLKLLKNHAFGVIDDFYENKYSYISLEKGENYVFLSENNKVTDGFSSFLMVLEKGNIELVDFENSSISEYEKKMVNDKEKYWLVKDTRLFYETFGMMKVHEFLENSQQRNHSFIFLVKNTSIMPFRDLNLCHHKICLQNHSIDEISTFLNAKINEKINGTQDGLLKGKHLYRMKIGLINYD